MTIWDLLKISKTTDQKAIKRAYAKQLKVHHPEDDPKGYQALREAYDAALSYAKNQASQPRIEQYREADEDSEDFKDDWDDWDDSTDPWSDSILTPPDRVPFIEMLHSMEETSPDPHDEIEFDVMNPAVPIIQTPDEFISHVIAIYDHFPSRISQEKWLELLNADILWNLDAKKVIKATLFTVLQTRKFLPNEIWRMLEHTFGWQEDWKDSKLDDYDNNDKYESAYQLFVAYYKKQISIPGLRYDFLVEAKDMNVDEFLKLRDQGYHALVNGSVSKALSSLKQAYAMFSDDPELLRLLGECYMRMDDYEASLPFWNRYIELLPNEVDGYLYRARIWHYTGNASRMLEECQYILSVWPNHTDARILAGYAQQKLGRHHEAIHSFREILQTRSHELTHFPEETRNSSSVWSRLSSYINRQNRRILLYICVSVMTTLVLIGCINYYAENTRSRKPMPITQLEQLHNQNEHKYATFPISAFHDLKIGKYVLDSKETTFQNQAYAFVHFNEYQNPTGYIYLGNILEQRVILITEQPLQQLDVQNTVELNGYVHPLDEDLRKSVIQMLLDWKPSFPPDSMEAKLEAYNKNLLEPAESTVSAALPEDILPIYLDIRDPVTRPSATPVNVILFGLITLLWLMSLYQLYFESRKIRLFKDLDKKKGANYVG